MRVKGRVHDGTGPALLPASHSTSCHSSSLRQWGERREGAPSRSRRAGEPRWAREEGAERSFREREGFGESVERLLRTRGLGACRTPEPSETPRRCRGSGECPHARGSPEGRAHPSGPAEGPLRVRESGAFPWHRASGAGGLGACPWRTAARAQRRRQAATARAV